MNELFKGMMEHDDHIRKQDDGKSREEYIKAPFSYLGSKKESLPYILPMLPIRKIWNEVFGGSGIVTLNRKESDLEIFNDRYSGVTSFYRVIKDSDKLDQLIDKLQLTIHSREEFIWCKTTWEDSCNDDVERAYRWYYMMQNSFGGRGKFFGRVIQGKSGIYKKINSKLQDFWIIHDRLKKVQIENLDWRQCLLDFDTKDTVHYCDPSYYGTKYYDYNLSEIEHKELCDRIFDLKGFVALSGYSNPIYDKYPWSNKISWKVRDLITTQSINTQGIDLNSVKRGKLVEYLWLKESN